MGTVAILKLDVVYFDNCTVTVVMDAGQDVGWELVLHGTYPCQAEQR